ncbi:hypothetical protein Ddc_17043 [Ditylenchus destructor]|nr:hypothetical protein Ddc_17043 [Ditylenchus destructor]
MQRMSEHTKEKAKAKIMELLVQFHFFCKKNVYTLPATQQLPPDNSHPKGKTTTPTLKRSSAAKVITTFERPFNFDDYQPGQSQQSSNNVQRDHSDMSRKRANDEGREKYRDEKPEYGNKRSDSERSSAAKVITTFERPFNFDDYQPGQSQQSSNNVQRDHPDIGRKRANDEGREKYRDEKPEYGNKRSRMDQFSVNRTGTFSQNDDEEDVLFCKIMLKKMQRMSEHTKEKAKAKIMELLVQFQYGEVS